MTVKLYYAQCLKCGRASPHYQAIRKFCSDNGFDLHTFDTRLDMLARVEHVRIIKELGLQSDTLRAVVDLDGRYSELSVW